MINDDGTTDKSRRVATHSDPSHTPSYWDPWRIDGGNVTIFLILSFSLCYHRTTHVYHADIGRFPYFLCAALYMLYLALCLTFYHALTSHVSYVYLSYSLLLQHGHFLYNLVSSYEIL